MKPALPFPVRTPARPTNDVPGGRDDPRSRRAAHLAEMMALTGSGDRAAFREVYLLTSAKLFGICLRVCGERRGAEDVLHEVYLTVWRRAGAWDPARGAAITWLAAIARNRSIDWRRAERYRSGMVAIDEGLEIADTADNAEMALLAGETERQLRQCLDTLDPRARSAIRAAFFDGLTYVELARRQGVPLSTMKSWIRRGLAKMRLDLAAAANG